MNVLQRNMFKGQMPQVSADGVGITSGLEEEQAMASTEALGGIASGVETLFQNIDGAENPKEIMDAIRGDEATVEERKTELAQLVGKDDAFKTPESVLTMVQPLMTIIQSSGGISDLDTETDETAMVAEGEGIASNIDEGNQMEAMARMQGGEQPVMLRKGSPNPYGTNLVGNPETSQNPNLQPYSDPLTLFKLAQSLTPTPKRKDYEGLYTNKPSAYDEYAKIAPWQLVSEFGRALGTTAGKNPFDAIMKSAMDPRVQKATDPLMKLRLLQAKEKTEREAKEATAYTEAKKEAEKQRVELYKPVLTEIAKGGDIQIIDDPSTGAKIALNTRTNEKTFITPTKKDEFQYLAQQGVGMWKINKTTGTEEILPNSLAKNVQIFTDDVTKKKIAVDLTQKDATGKYKTYDLTGGLSASEQSAQYMKSHVVDGALVMYDTRNPTIKGGDGLPVPNVTILREGKDEIEPVSVKGQGIVLVNKTKQTAKLLPGTLAANNILAGTEKTGFGILDLNTNTYSPIEGLKPVGTDDQKEIQQFFKAKNILDNSNQYSPNRVAKAKMEYKIFANKFYPKDSEFEKVLGRELDLRRAELAKTMGLAIDHPHIQEAMSDIEHEWIKDWLTKKTTTTTMYDPSKAKKDVYAKAILKKQEDLDKVATQNEDLALKSSIVMEHQKNVRTGIFAPLRLTMGKFLRDTGLESSFLEASGVTRTQYEDFLGGKLGEMEVINKIGAQFAVTFASNFPGNLNQSEVDLIKEAGVNLGTTNEGIALMDKLFQAQKKRATGRAEWVNNYLADAANSGKNVQTQYGEILTGLRQYNKDNPIVSKLDIKTVKDAKGGLDESGQGFFEQGSNQPVKGIITNQVKEQHNFIQSKLSTDPGMDADTFLANHGDAFRKLLEEQYEGKIFNDADMKKNFNILHKLRYGKLVPEGTQ